MKRTMAICVAISFVFLAATNCGFHYFRFDKETPDLENRSSLFELQLIGLPFSQYNCKMIDPQLVETLAKKSKSFRFNENARVRVEYRVYSRAKQVNGLLPLLSVFSLGIIPFFDGCHWILEFRILDRKTRKDLEKFSIRLERLDAVSIFYPWKYLMSGVLYLFGFEYNDQELDLSLIPQWIESRFEEELTKRAAENQGLKTALMSRGSYDSPRIEVLPFDQSQDWTSVQKILKEDLAESGVIVAESGDSKYNNFSLAEPVSEQNRRPEYVISGKFRYEHYVYHGPRYIHLYIQISDAERKNIAKKSFNLIMAGYYRDSRNGGGFAFYQKPDEYLDDAVSTAIPWILEVVERNQHQKSIE